MGYLRSTPVFLGSGKMKTVAPKVGEAILAPDMERPSYLLTSESALFDTTTRAVGGNLNCAGAHHGNLTPPRISPSCFTEVPL